MGLTIRFSHSAAATIQRLPIIDRKAIRKVLHVLAASPDKVRSHPRAIVVRDAPEGLVVYTFIVGDWKLVLVLDADDLVVTDVVGWDQGPL